MSRETLIAILVMVFLLLFLNHISPAEAVTAAEAVELAEEGRSIPMLGGVGTSPGFVWYDIA